MALYVNFMMNNYGIAGIGEYGSAFRIHRQQTSANNGPTYSAGLFEWEAIRRWSIDHGFLSRSTFEKGIAVQNAMYSSWVGKYPELKPFLGLKGQPGIDRYFSPEFDEALSLAYLQIEMRKMNL